MGSDTETHLPSHFLKPASQLPMTHSPASHVKVPPVARLGHEEASQESAPHPNAGSAIETHVPPQLLLPAPHSAITHAPSSHASDPVPASGHRDGSHRVGSQP